MHECGPGSDFPGVHACTKTCEEDPRHRAERCRDPRHAYARCVTALPCDQVRAHQDLEIAKTGPCAAETAAVLGCEPDGPPTPFIYFQF